MNEEIERIATANLASARKADCILDQFHAIDFTAATVQVLAPDKGEREARMQRTGRQLNDGRVAELSATLSRTTIGKRPSRPASTTLRPTVNDCAATAAGSVDCRSDPNQADYSFEARYAKEDTLAAIDRAEDAINKLNGANVHHRRGFVAHLLFKQRSP